MVIRTNFIEFQLGYATKKAVENINKENGVHAVKQRTGYYLEIIILNRKINLIFEHVNHLIQRLLKMQQNQIHLY